MKRVLAVAIAPIVLGIIAAFFRARELAFSFDFTTGLPKETLIATPVLLGAAVILLLAALIGSWKRKLPVSEPSAHPALVTVSLFGCAVMLALGGLEIYTNRFTRDVILYVHCALTFLCSAAFAILGLRCLRANQNGIYSFFAIVPVFWACFSLIMIFRERIADPIIADYIFLLFAFICILLFTYAQAGYIYRKNRIKVALCTAVLGSYFCVIELLAPWIASRLSQAYVPLYDFTMILPLLLFAVYMPVSALCMLKNENDV